MKKMLFIGLDDKFDEILGEYLINVLNIPQLWEEKKSLKQKDDERRKLHDKLAKILGLEDRDIISKCTENGAYPAYMEFGSLRKAKNAFCHEYNLLTGNCVVAPEEESKLKELYDELGTTGRIRNQIHNNLYKYCKTERGKHYRGIYEKHVEEYSKLPPSEILEELKKIPDRYLELYNDLGERYSGWSHWFDTVNWEPGNGFACAFYDMESYFYCHNFYHDYGQRIRIVENAIKKWVETPPPEVVKWGYETLAKFRTWLDAAEEFLKTPFEDIIKIFLSFKDEDILTSEENTHESTGIKSETSDADNQASGSSNQSN